MISDTEALEQASARLQIIADESHSGYRFVKLVPPTQFIAILPLMYTAAIIRGRIADIMTSYDDRWCFHGLDAAKAALDAWDGNGEPVGWHRHPSTGRRRPDGDPAREYIAL
jgi:hypothetical protein